MNEGSQRPILIVLIAGIGDLVMASKAMRAIRNGFPDRKIHLLTSTEATPLARNYTFLDEVIPFPIRELRREKSYLIDIWRLLLDLRKTQFDVVVNLYQVSSISGALKMGLLFMILRAGKKIGHDCKGFGWFTDIRIPADTFVSRHRVDALLKAAVMAGGKPDDKGIEVFWDKASEEKWSDVLRQARFAQDPRRDGRGGTRPSRNPPNPPVFTNGGPASMPAASDLKEARGAAEIVVGINPGGDRANRRWDAANYAAVADRIVEQYGARIVLFGGPGEEHIAQDIQSRMKHKATDLAGKLTLNELAYVIRRLDLLITNDSGPMHIAAAVKTPQVAIFGPEVPERLRPYAPSKTYRVVFKTIACRPCNTDTCDHVSCLRSITVDEVFDAAESLLERGEHSTSNIQR